MEEIIVLGSLSVLLLVATVVVFILAFVRRNKELLRSGLIVFVVFAAFSGYTLYSILTQTYNWFEETFEPRSGEEIYEALLGAPEYDCVEVLNYQDNTIPIMDNTILLHFKCCPKELQRILSEHEYSRETICSKDFDGEVPYGEHFEWFWFQDMGDSVVSYVYSTANEDRIRWLWSSKDSSRVLYSDMVY